MAQYIAVDELTKLKNINNDLLSLECEIGKLEVLKQLTIQKHIDLQKQSVEFNTSLNQKYGDCQVDLQSGEISKNS